MDPNARLFNCVRCHKQVIICSDCDRGNIYCSSSCSRIARKLSCRAASKRYQSTRPGQHRHAERQRCYRLRQQKSDASGFQVDENHSSLEDGEDTLLSDDKQSTCCHFCGKSVSTFLRLGHLRSKVTVKLEQTSTIIRGP